MHDEELILDLFQTWQEASRKGDLETLLPLMDKDVVFLVAGHPPLRGRDAFASSFKGMITQYRVESTAENKELRISGDLAYAWNYLTVNMIPLNGGEILGRAGDVVTVLRKDPRGHWLLFRDANLLMPNSSR